MTKPTTFALLQTQQAAAEEMREEFRSAGRDFAQRIDRMRAQADDFVRRKKQERRASRDGLPAVKR